MDSSRPDRILEEWSAVADGARRPAMPPRRVDGSRGLAGLSLAGAGLSRWCSSLRRSGSVALGRPDRAVSFPPSRHPRRWSRRPQPSDSPTPTPTPSTTPAPTPTATATPTAHATPTAEPRIGACAPRTLRPGSRCGKEPQAHGSRDVEVTNTGRELARLEKLERPQLIDGAGRILIDGAAPATGGVIEIAPSGRAHDTGRAGNYCGARPGRRPVRVAFVLRDGQRFIAAPPTPTDATVPPCNGQSQPGVIGMHPWAR